MPAILTPEQEGMVLAFHGLKYSTRMIVKQLKMSGVAVSQSTVCNIINNKCKMREAKERGEEHRIERSRPKRTKQFISAVKAMAQRENPPTQEAMARKLSSSARTIRRAIHEDLGMNTRTKSRVHQLTEAHEKRRVVTCKKLLQTGLSDDRLEFAVTLDEAWLYLQDCNTNTSICYIEKGESVPQEWVAPHRETFGPKVMVVAVLTGRGVGPLFIVPPKAKIDASTYIKDVLRPLVENFLPKIYPNELEKVWIHHDAATAHTSSETKKYCEKVTQTHKISFIKKEDIPVKSPDCSPLDFFGFGYLKNRLKERRVRGLSGMVRAAKEEWSRITPETVKKVYLSWIKRAQLIIQNKGKHIENSKLLHKRVFQEINDNLNE